MKLSDHQWEFLQDVAELIDYAKFCGVKLTGGELWRPQETQDIYVEQGKSWNKDGQHPKRLAIDLNLFIDDQYKTHSESYQFLGDFWESLSEHNIWGGRFNDGNHFERRTNTGRSAGI